MTDETPQSTVDRTQSLGWKPDLPDFRDHAFDVGVAPLPPSVRLDSGPQMPPVYDQGNLGSCTANALAGAIEFDLRRQGLADFMPSRLFIYYNERVIEKTTLQDSGAMIRDGAKTLHRQGVCSETTWPYDQTQFAAMPTEAAYTEALQTKTIAYARVARGHMRYVLAKGVPVTVGFTVYDNFYQIGDDGIMQMPSGNVVGGHAVLVCGYDTPLNDGRVYFRCRNSWSNSWGNAGYFWMPIDYLTNVQLSSDFWMIQTVS